MAFPLPDPEAVAEQDEQLGARFIGLLRLLELKAGGYMQKNHDEGPEVAAKDLADVVALIQANSKTLPADAFDACHPAVRAELKRIMRVVTGPRGRRGPRDSP